MLNVLIADDEAAVRKGIQRLLPWESLGFSIAGSVADGNEALAFLQNNPVDVLLTDIQMPDMDGLELIRQARARFPALECIIVSGYEQFDYARRAMQYGVRHYLLKPVTEEELAGALRGVALELGRASGEEEGRNRLAQELLFCQLPEDEAEAALRALYAGREPEFFSVDIVKLYIPARYASQANRIVYNAQRSLREFIAKAFTGPPIAVAVAGRLLYLLYGGTRGEMEACKGAAQVLRDHLSSLQFHAVVCRGGVAETPAGLRASVETAMALLDQSFYQQPGSILTEEELIRRCQEEDMPWQEEALFQAVREGDEAVAGALAEELFACLKRCAMPQEAAISMLTGILFGLNQRLDAMGSSLRQVAGSDMQLHQELQGFLCADDMRDWFSGLCRAAAGKAAAMREEKREDLVSRVLRIVDARYTGGVKLKDIAEELHFSPDYIGRRFREETGLPFQDYVNKKRIEQAQALLAQTDWPIYRISEQVGFQTVDYFTQLFKKQTGMLPTQARKARRK